MAYGDFIDLNRRTTADKVSRDKSFNIAENPKCDEYRRGLASMVYNGFSYVVFQWFFVCVIDFYRKYVWVIPLENDLQLWMLFKIF